MTFAALLLLAAAGSQPLLDEVFQIPASEWRYVPVDLKKPPVMVQGEFRVISGNGRVRVVLLSRAGLDQLRQGDREPMGSGTYQSQGAFNRMVNVPDEYAVVLENSSRGPVRVQLRVSLDFSERARPQVGYLSPERRFAVIIISLSVFLAIVIFSARKLREAMR
jgi:hypothetical protein